MKFIFSISTLPLEKMIYHDNMQHHYHFQPYLFLLVNFSRFLELCIDAEWILEKHTLLNILMKVFEKMFFKNTCIYNRLQVPSNHSNLRPKSPPLLAIWCFVSIDLLSPYRNHHCQPFWPHYLLWYDPIKAFDLPVDSLANQVICQENILGYQP